MTWFMVVGFIAASAGCTDAGSGGLNTGMSAVDSSAPTSESSTTVAVTTTIIIPAPETTDVAGHLGIRIEIVEARWGSGEGSGRVLLLIRNPDIASWTTDGMRLVDTENESSLFELVAQRQYDVSIRLYIDDGDPIPGKAFTHPHAAGINGPTLMIGFFHSGPGSEEFVMSLDSGGYEVAGLPLEEIAMAVWSRAAGAGS